MARLYIVQSAGGDQIHACRPFQQQFFVLFKFDFIAHKRYSNTIMKKVEKIFIGAGLIAVVAVIGGAMVSYSKTSDLKSSALFPTTQYGAFLAAQHAIYVNDFEKAAEFSDMLTKTEYVTVQNTKFLSGFLSGKMPVGVEGLKSEKTPAAKIVYDAYLVVQDDWKSFHNRHKTDESSLMAPFRIWSAIPNDWRTNTFKFIDRVSASDSWKAFVRGQIYVELGDIDKANKEFAKVHPDFMNINDYIYLMSFYSHFGLDEDARILHDDFVARPGGMFMAGVKDFPAWENFSGYKNQLSFSLLQTVSHTQIMMYSDLAILYLRFAQVISPDFAGNNDAINYYLGQYFYTNKGDYKYYFDKISSSSPFKLFADLRVAERDGDMDKMVSILDKSPVFVPAITAVVSKAIQNGNRRTALRVIDKALKSEGVDEIGRSFLYKSRAQVNYAFGDFDDAQSDLHSASTVIGADADILLLQAKIWAAQKREIENAYDYAMELVRQNPSDVFAWDALGRVVLVREGPEPAMELISKVGEVSNTCSSLFDIMGDLYKQIGDSGRAYDAYTRAIELSGDGMVVVPQIERKLRNLK